MPPVLFVATVLFILHLSTSNRVWPELNPALGGYQDIEKCFPVNETWYMVYRNYESDPLLGSATKCLKFTETGPPVNGEYPLLGVAGNQTLETKLSFRSSSGYTSKNVINWSKVGGGFSVDVYTAFVDCKRCLILREAYVSDSACSMVVPQSQLHQKDTSCDFIFDLLCGATPKVYIDNEDCNAVV